MSFRRFFRFWPALLLSLLAFAPPSPRATVYVFLAPTCPISQAVTPALRALTAQYGPRGVRFVGVFPDGLLKPKEIIDFGRDYQLAFSLEADPRQVLARRLGARITPEAVVLTAYGQTVYRGRIDDSYARLGVRRTVVQHHELADALAALDAGRAVAIPRAEAVGCFIEFGPARH